MLSQKLKRTIVSKFGKPEEWKSKLSLIKLRKLGHKIGMQRAAVKGMSAQTLLPFLLKTWKESNLPVKDKQGMRHTILITLRTHIHTYTYTYMHTYEHTHIHIHTHTHTHTYTPTHLQTYTHTYTRIHTLSRIAHTENSCIDISAELPLVLTTVQMINVSATSSVRCSH